MLNKNTWGVKKCEANQKKGLISDGANKLLYQILACVPALREGWGRVSYDHAFGAPTCGLKKICDKRKNAHSKFLRVNSQTR